MKLYDLYQAIIQKGMDQDPRREEELSRVLKQTSMAYEKLDESEKKFFDIEKLVNPYSDTRILNGDRNLEVTSILCGIDMEVGELLLADRLREKGTPIDLVLAHHPEGAGFANLYEVMGMQADLWALQGVAIGAADALIAPRSQEIRRKILPVNHYRSVDAAKLLNLAMMCCHTPADNCVSSFLTRYLAEEKPATLGAVVKALRAVPEYEDAFQKGVGPTLICGSESARPGKIFVDMTGGTSGPTDSLNRLSQAGVDTIVGMHMSEEHKKRAEELKMSVIIAGHIASDALGMNLVLDGIEAQGVSILCTSGMIRVNR